MRLNHIISSLVLLVSPILGDVLQVPIGSKPTGLIKPYTDAWVHVLEQFYNTLPHTNRTDRDGSCLHQVPAFKCPPFYWDDSIENRDAKHLRPQDIKSVIALGDSITAGFGMISGRPPFASVWEHRGKAFSVGADVGEHTLTNFMSHFTNTHGAPEGVTLPMARGKRLNNAVTGAKVQDLDIEVTRLVRLLKSSSYDSIRDEWKLITIFVGANNICVLCNDERTGLPSQADADVFEDSMRQVMERLRTEVGKSFVNLVALFNVSSVYEASRGDPYCEFILDPSHLSVCSCIQGDEKQRLAADLVVMEYNTRLEKIAFEYNELNDRQFGVGYQPGFMFFPVGQYKQHYLSGFDCFHPNKCANQVMAIVLWNNMFSTPEEKTKKYTLENITIQCPGPDRPYLQ
ncbi:secreted phospholipase B1 [Phycomyces blakesleeanus]|uniref:Secreted phospholipase B1 n=2 Tax=Phycomyces blakesleeanus TaxID=4837 RepID=A0A162TQ48_PHYB8|nr:secreted phospholipase B1 [Phycomyces blakesleeanus NRRL 1555(-)]OAD70182.1 secreted phospholipase B1 [Phycomyces blakesleeanus NRRL 1555(-)]|eukprot:XP_018288222.1 secreted phospholipase B1 [Phycomyces blakesleeanus NRRL 1555(-)]